MKPSKTLRPAEREFLEKPYVGVVTDLRTDGSPHTTVVWVDVDDEGVSFNTARGRLKERDLVADPRLSLLVVDPSDPYRWISVTGEAALLDEGADDHIDRLAKKYLGADSYPFRSSAERRVTVRITPSVIESRGI
jgi:PPOX class probable F420-dependent enzyme